MTALRSMSRRFFRGTAFARLLKRCGIEPHQYWLLVDLFETLSERREMARIGSHDYSLRFVAIFWFILGSVASLLMAVIGASPGVYLLVFGLFRVSSGWHRPRAGKQATVLEDRRSMECRLGRTRADGGKVARSSYPLSLV